MYRPTEVAAVLFVKLLISLAMAQEPTCQKLLSDLSPESTTARFVRLVEHLTHHNKVPTGELSTLSSSHEARSPNTESLTHTETFVYQNAFVSLLREGIDWKRAREAFLHILQGKLKSEQKETLAHETAEPILLPQVLIPDFLPMPHSLVTSVQAWQSPSGKLFTRATTHTESRIFTPDGETFSLGYDISRKPYQFVETPEGEIFYLGLKKVKDSGYFLEARNLHREGYLFKGEFDRNPEARLFLRHGKPHLIFLQNGTRHLIDAATGAGSALQTKFQRYSISNNGDKIIGYGPVGPYKIGVFDALTGIWIFSESFQMKANSPRLVRGFLNSKDEPFIVAIVDNHIHFFDVTRGSHRALPHPTMEKPSRFLETKDGRVIYVFHKDRGIVASYDFSADTLTEIPFEADLPLDGIAPYELPDGRIIAIGTLSAPSNFLFFDFTGHSVVSHKNPIKNAVSTMLLPTHPDGKIFSVVESKEMGKGGVALLQLFGPAEKKGNGR